MATTLTTADLETEVWRCLARVTDPELDEPLTDLGFVERVAVIDNQRVEVGFRLPTYWCSPNFAFLMAFGIRREIETLSWVEGFRVELRDHCFGDEVNAGVNDGRAKNASAFSVPKAITTTSLRADKRFSAACATKAALAMSASTNAAWATSYNADISANF